MNALNFWYTWLKVTIVLIIAAGIALIVLSKTSVFINISESLNYLFFANQMDNTSILFQEKLYTISGIFAVLYGLIIFVLAFYAMRKKEFRFWNIIFISIIVWFVFDTSFSIYYHSIINVLLNFIIFFQITAPLLFIRNTFKQNQQVSI